MIFRERVRLPWQAPSEPPAAPGRNHLDSSQGLANTRTEVCVVGGGIVGLTTAYRLARAGAQVTLVEGRRIGSGESGRSTALLNTFIDTYPDALIKRLGRDTAQLMHDGLVHALAMIEEVIGWERIECDFKRLPGFLLAENEAQAKQLGKIAGAAQALGMTPTSTEVPPYVLGMIQAVCLPDQGRLDPGRYLRGLANGVRRAGVRVFEETRVVDVSRDPPHVVSLASGDTFEAMNVVLASHVPFGRGIGLNSKQAAYRTYVLGLAVPAGKIDDAVFLDLERPYHYARLLKTAANDQLLVGGEDHKVGHPPRSRDPFGALHAFAKRHFGVDGDPEYLWSGQILEPIDGLPFIGATPGKRTEYVATGFGGDGLTCGTLAAHMISERILGRSTGLDEALAPSRRAVAHGVRDFVVENVDFPAHLVGDRLRPETADRPLAGLHAGEGGIFQLGTQKLAVSRLDNGHFAALKPTCSHRGCSVHWNQIEGSWDCPCHGSRFSADGEVLNGPAAMALTSVPLEGVTVATTPESEASSPALSQDWATT